MRSEPVSEDELNKFKRNFKKNWLDAMKSNSGMARVLAQAEVLMGDWRLLFRMLEDVDMVTSEDVQLVAEKYLIKKNRTVAELISRK